MSTSNSVDTITIPAGETTGAEVVSAQSTTGDGFLTGVEPAKSPDQLRAEQQAANQPPAQPAATQPQSSGERLFTATEVEEFRKQEKDKMYGRVETMEQEVKRLREEREAERKAAEEEQARIEAEAKAKAEEGMDVRDLLKQTREEFQAEIAAAKEEAARAQAMLEQEQRLAALSAYRTQALQAVGDRLVPEFADFIGGDTPEQIDASIADALERSDRVIQGMMAAQQQQLQGMQGARVTAPTGNGPLEEQQEQRQISVEDIRRMSPSEYAAHRGILQQAGRNQFYGNR
jgi:uncharacterized membrane protein YqiK